MADDSIPVSRIARRAWERMRDATLQVERMTQGGAEPPRQRSSLPSAGRWARITEGEDGKYSWIGLKPNDEDSLVEDESWGKGDHTKDEGYAVELRHKSKHIPNNSIVWLTPAKGKSYYLFEYNPGILVARLAAASFIGRRQDSGAISRPGNGMVELLKVNNGANPDSETDDEFESTGTMVKVFNWTKTTVGGSSARPVLIEFGSSGRFWLVGDEC